MYQIIETYGDFEPWWFLDGWEKEVTDKKEFADCTQAERYFLQKVAEYKTKFAQMKEKEIYSVAFWDKDDLRWCEECDDDLQQYHGLLMLKDGKQLNGQDNVEEKIARGRCCPLAR